MTRAPEAEFRWQGRARWRRSLFLVLVLVSVAAAGWMMREVLPYHGAKPLEIAILALERVTRLSYGQSATCA